MITPSPNKAKWDPEVMGSVRDWADSSLEGRRELWRDRHQIPTALPWVEVALWGPDSYFFFGAAFLPLIKAGACLVGLATWSWFMFIASCIVSMVGWIGLTVAATMLNCLVDDQGLWLRHRGLRLWPSDRVIRFPRHRFLPAHEIGSIWVIHGGLFSSIPSTYSYRGLPIGGGQINIMRGADRAVLVHQTRPGLKRAYWLLDHDNPQILAAALRLCREQAWQGASTETRLQTLFALSPDDTNPTNKETHNVPTELREPPAKASQGTGDQGRASQGKAKNQLPGRYQIKGGVNVVARTAAADGTTTVAYRDDTEAGHPAEKMSLVAEIGSSDGAFSVAFVAGDEGKQTFVAGGHALATWITELVCHPDHDSDEQLFRFPDEKSMLAAHHLLHTEALLRSEVQLDLVSPDVDPSQGSGHGDVVEKRQVTIYVMADSTWLLEHVEPTDAGRYLQLRSIGRQHLTSYLEHLLVVPDLPLEEAVT